jgi:anti-sigma regulatory factor (Ser/Thr protein kinase)
VFRMGVHLQQRETPEGRRRLMSCRFGAAPQAAAQARCATRSFLRRRLDEDAMDDVLLATTELVTNAVKYGEGRVVWLHVLVGPHELALTVSNAGTDWAAPASVRSAPGLVADAARLPEGGRGLGIVRELCDEVAVRSGAMTVVRVTLRLPPDGRPVLGGLRMPASLSQAGTTPLRPDRRDNQPAHAA